MSLDFRYPTPLPSTKGWGPGWPDCQRDKLVTVPPFVGGFREEIAELMGLIVAEMVQRGFDFMSPGCWGFGCRATKGGGGAIPSFHSWGLAGDINAPRNVFGAAESTSEIATRQRWVVPFMASYGFFWLGPPIKDWMHFSFVGSRDDAEVMTNKARRELMADERLDQLQAGEEAFRDAYHAKGEDPGPPPEGKPVWFRKGWVNARFAANNPKPEAPGTAIKRGDTVKLA